MLHDRFFYPPQVIKFVTCNLESTHEWKASWSQREMLLFVAVCESIVMSEERGVDLKECWTANQVGELARSIANEPCNIIATSTIFATSIDDALDMYLKAGVKECKRPVMDSDATSTKLRKTMKIHHKTLGEMQDLRKRNRSLKSGHHGMKWDTRLFKAQLHNLVVVIWEIFLGFSIHRSTPLNSCWDVAWAIKGCMYYMTCSNIFISDPCGSLIHVDHLQFASSRFSSQFLEPFGWNYCLQIVSKDRHF